MELIPVSCNHYNHIVNGVIHCGWQTMANIQKSVILSSNVRPKMSRHRQISQIGHVGCWRICHGRYLTTPIELLDKQYYRHSFCN